MKIFLGSDHAGFALKKRIAAYLETRNHQVADLGCENEESCDYPGYAVSVAESVVKNEQSFGIVVCGTGIGVSIAANKVHGARAALCNSKELAKLSREHNGANILALGARIKNIDDPLEIVDQFLSTQEDSSDRHARRRHVLTEL